MQEFYRVDEVAKILGVKVGWVYERTRTRAIPVVKLGRHVRILSKDLEAWIDSHREEGSDAATKP